MDKAVLFIAFGLGAVTTVVGVMELYSYRKFRQAYVDANLLKGTKSTKEG